MEYEVTRSLLPRLPAVAMGRWTIPTLLILGVVAVGVWFWKPWQESAGGAPREAAGDAAVWMIPPEFSAERSYAYLQQICALGPRPSGSDAMVQQQQLVQTHFESHGAVVVRQTFDARHPLTGQPVPMVNLIARWFPTASQRILICAHYDTRPFPDKDPRNPRGVFIGANDGGSGAAVMMELAHHLGRLPGNVGVDLVLFDGEELVFREGQDPYFLGSTHFAQNYAAGNMPGTYAAGALLDMVGDKELGIFYEKNSFRMARQVCQEIWGCAARLRIDAFVPHTRHEVRDDHLPLNNIGKIPTADLIDFDYPRPGWREVNYWHTTQDTPDKCSGRSLCAVAAVMFEWLKLRSGAMR